MYDQSIVDRLTANMKEAGVAYEAEAWAKALKCYMIAVGIKVNLDRSCPA